MAADTLALEKLFLDVQTQFAADGTNVPNLFGWRERTKHVLNLGAPQTSTLVYGGPMSATGDTPPQIVITGTLAGIGPNSIIVTVSGAGPLGVWFGAISYTGGPTDQVFTSSSEITLVGLGTGLVLEIAEGTASADNVWTASGTPAPTPGNRIIWVPGNEPGNGDVGKHTAPSKNAGHNPRSLATLNEVFTVYVQGSDPRAPASELAQYKVTRLLYDAWLRAVYLAAYGTFTIEALSWDRTKTERQHGAMLIAICTIQASVPDAAFAVVDPITIKAFVSAHEGASTDPTFEVDPKP